MVRTLATATENNMAISTDELMNRLQSGRKTALEIGMKAGARVQIGRRVLWNVKKVQEYLDVISV